MTKLSDLLNGAGLDADVWRAYGHLFDAHVSLLAAWEIMAKAIFRKAPQRQEEQPCPSPDANVVASASAGIGPSPEA